MSRKKICVYRFNLGVGLVIVAASDKITDLAEWASNRQTPLYIIGEVV